MQEEGARVPQNAPLRVVILGAGAIGQSFAAVFEDAGAAVTLAEPDTARREAVPQGLAVQRDAIALARLTRNGGGNVTIVPSANAEVGAADLVIECGPENVEAKRAIFAGLLALAGPETVLATASSAIAISRIVEDEAQQRRCLVAHPINPPAVLRMVELVPAPGTLPGTMARAEALFGAAGFAAVKLGREIEGFVLNRLQGAILREAYRLVDEGVTDVAGIEAGVRLGLGPRWALSGPFETAELNTPGGIVAHAARMGPAYRRMGEARGETVDWRPDLVARVAAERRLALPEDRIPARVGWRARAVARLVAARDRLLGDADE